jgi:hypothetical protein
MMHSTLRLLITPVAALLAMAAFTASALAYQPEPVPTVQNTINPKLLYAAEQTVVIIGDLQATRCARITYTHLQGVPNTNIGFRLDGSPVVNVNLKDGQSKVINFGAVYNSSGFGYLTAQLYPTNATNVTITATAVSC